MKRKKKMYLVRFSCVVEENDDELQKIKNWTRVKIFIKLQMEKMTNDFELSIKIIGIIWY